MSDRAVSEHYGARMNDWLRDSDWPQGTWAVRRRGDYAQIGFTLVGDERQSVTLLADRTVALDRLAARGEWPVLWLRTLAGKATWWASDELR